MAVKKKSKYEPEKIFVSELGKVPPQAIDLEEAVLGAIMIERDAIIAVLDILRPDSFYKESHQKIYRAIVALITDNSPIDMLTVTSQLKKTSELEEVGGQSYIAQLTHKVASSAHIEFHARIIQQKFIQRELIRVSNEILFNAYDDSIDVDDLLDESEHKMFEVASGNIKRETREISGILKDAINRIQEAQKRESHLVGVPSGFTDLDRITAGWQPSDLIIIAARPSMGKTAFVLSMTRNIAIEHNKRVAFFSLEMSSLQIVNRMIVMEAELPSDKIRTGKLSSEEWKQLDYRIKPLDKAQIFIDDTPGISIFELRAKCRRLKQQHNIDIIIIDYLQLMNGPPETKGNREQEVSTISRSLKALSKELDVPVIALSQLNRMVEQRTGNKRPHLSDLRESGAIEQDADIVIFIHRREKYGIDVFEEDPEQTPTKGIAEIIIAKHRNGATDDVRLRFKEAFARFSDLDESFSLDNNVVGAMTIGSKMNIETDSSFETATPMPRISPGEAPF